MWEGVEQRSNPLAELLDDAGGQTMAEMPSEGMTVGRMPDGEDSDDAADGNCQIEAPKRARRWQPELAVCPCALQRRPCARCEG